MGAINLNNDEDIFNYYQYHSQGKELQKEYDDFMKEQEKQQEKYKLFFDFKNNSDKKGYKKQCEEFLEEHGIKLLENCFSECVQIEKYEQCIILKKIINKYYKNK